MFLFGKLARLDTKWLVLCFVAVYAALAIVLMPSYSVSAQAGFNSVRDCDSNAVINCGAMTVAELQQKYNADSSVQAAFNCFGIEAADINNIGSTAVNGQVTKSGDVVVAGKVVATGAMTAGRQNIAGSTTILCGGFTFYKRPPSVSFVSSPLDAFVVMNNGQFVYAILASCGNPVNATPVAKPTPPAPKVTPPPPAPVAPAPPPPAPAPNAPKPAPKPTPPPVLPATGAEGVVGVFAGSSAIAGLGHYLWRRKFGGSA